MTVYSRCQHLIYTAPQLFDLAADVERFPEFMPWITEARIRRRRNNAIFVNMTIAKGPLRRPFSTVGRLDRPHRIDITSAESIFDRFQERWRFQPAGDGGTDVYYSVESKLRSHLLQAILAASFARQAAATIAAFTDRAHQLMAKVHHLISKPVRHSARIADAHGRHGAMRAGR